MHHTITPVAFIELLMSFTLCVFDINETDDNVDNTAALRTTTRKKEREGERRKRKNEGKNVQARRITATFHTLDSLSIIG